MNPTFLIVITITLLTFANTQVSFAQTVVPYDFTVNVISGPLSGSRYRGITSVDLTNLANNNETVAPTSIMFDFGGIEFTKANDVQDVDARSPRANFQDGNFIGNIYIVSRFGNNPTDIPLINNVQVDGFAIDNSNFGYIVGADLYTGTVSYKLPPSSAQPKPQRIPESAPPQPVPEPSVWAAGLTIAGWWWLRRRRNA